MAFWKDRFGKQDDDVPEELKGKSPEDIVKALKKAEAAEAAAAKADELEGRLTTQTTEFEAMKAKLAMLEANQPPPANEPPPEPASPWIDPEKFVADQTKSIANTALMSGMMTAKMYCQQNLGERDLKIFKKYEQEIVQLVGQSVPEQRVMPQTWFNMLMYVKGIHEMDIKKAETDHTDFFAETASRGSEPPPEDTDKLSPEEEEVCRKFKYDPERYLARKKLGVEARGEKGSYARFSVPQRQTER
jgi:hypothetical protein